MAFCEGCGSALATDALFCEACGRPVPQDPQKQEDKTSVTTTQVVQAAARVVKEMRSAAPNEIGESVIASWKGSSF